MKKNLLSIFLASTITISLLTGCGNKSENNTELVDFRTNVDSFCDSINQIDRNINGLDFTDSEYISVLTDNLNQLDENFKVFADMDFPKDYDYLENLADEASSYMTTAVTTYKDVFENNYTEEAMDEKYAYATENYSRAYKRIQIIVTFLNGHTSEDTIFE